MHKNFEAATVVFMFNAMKYFLLHKIHKLDC